MAQNLAQRYTGSSVKRSEDPRILTGRGRYVDDLSFPNMVHAHFLRSPSPHALIRSIDVSAARSAPGVVAVYTGEDMASMVNPGPTGMAAIMGGPNQPSFSLIATDKVRLVGDLVALIVA